MYNQEKKIILIHGVSSQILRAICELHPEKHSNRQCSPELHLID